MAARVYHSMLRCCGRRVNNFIGLLPFRRTAVSLLAAHTLPFFHVGLYGHNADDDDGDRSVHTCLFERLCFAAVEVDRGLIVFLFFLNRVRGVLGRPDDTCCCCFVSLIAGFWRMREKITTCGYFGGEEWRERHARVRSRFINRMGDKGIV